MAMEEKASQKALTSPLSDSVELDSFPTPMQPYSTGWLDAVHGTCPSAPPSATPAPFCSNACAAVTSHMSTTARRESAQRNNKNEQTPTASRHPAEATMMGSPIPVESDYSDTHIQQLVSRVTTKTTSDHHTTSPGAGRCLVATPAPMQQKVFCSTSASSLEARSDCFPLGSAPQPMPANWTVTDTLPSPVAFQRSPFGESDLTETNAPTRSKVPTDDDTATFTGESLERQVPQPPTAYTSALMQALSRTEGAAAMRSPWALATQRGGSSAHYLDSDIGKGSSGDNPPDIYVEGMRAKVAKQQWIALEKARQEVLEEARRRRDCPFAPQVSSYAARIRRPASLRPENRFNAEIIRRKQWLARRQSEEVERELKPCTFRPLILRAAQLDPAVMESPRKVTNVFYDLYEEAGIRRAFERDVKPKLVHQVEERCHHSPVRMAPAQLVQVVERLCARGVVRGGIGARQKKDSADLVPHESEARSGNFVGRQSEEHHPTLSTETQRIVAAKVTSGERDTNIVKQLYRHADQDVARQHLKRELDREQARLAQAEQALELAHDRKQLQQEYYRAVLVAKFHALARHVACTQNCAYRATAPQSVVQLAHAALEILSTDETEELLGAVEHCGRGKLRESEFVSVVLQYLAEKQVTPAQSALLHNAPPPQPSTGAPASAATLKRADSAGGILVSAESSPAGLPRVKREKPDPEVIEQVRARRARELAEWKKENQRQRAIADGVHVEGPEYTFQPAPRCLIPYACRPDVTVPVASTKSEKLRRAYVSARMQDNTRAPAVDSVVPAVSAGVLTASRAIAREVFARGPPYRTPSSMRERSQSAAARFEKPTEQDRSAASPTPTTMKPSAISPASSKCSSAEAVRTLSASLAGRRDIAAPEPRTDSPASVPAGQSALATHQPSMLTGGPAPTSIGHSNPLARLPTSASSCQRRCNSLAATPSLVEQIVHSSPADRARLGRELLLRQVREHQRRSGALD